MMTATVMCGDKQFSVDSFQEDSQMAYEFLKIFESNSFNVLPPGWEGYDLDHVIQEACYRLHNMEHDLVKAEILRLESKAH